MTLVLRRRSGLIRINAAPLPEKKPQAQCHPALVASAARRVFPTDPPAHAGEGEATLTENEDDANRCFGAGDSCGGRAGGRIDQVFGAEVVQHVEFIRLKGAVTCSGLPIVRRKGAARPREVMRILEDEGVYIADPHTSVVEDGGKKSINPRHVELKLAMDPAGLLNPGKLRAWDERDAAQRKSVFWDS